MITIKNFVDEWKKKDVKERVYMTLGAVFLVAALVGVAIPVVPQIPFAVIAAFFFSKGSRRIHRWIRHNRFFGKPVRDWEDHQVIRPKLKIISTVTMIAGSVIAVFELKSPWTIIVPCLFAIALVFVLTRKSKSAWAI